MKVGFIGLGMVGKTTAEWFRENTDHDLVFHDPAQDRKGDLRDCQAILIAVPVDTNEDGTQDVEILKEAMEYAIEHKPEKIFIRSTVLPGTCQRMSMVYGVDVYSMPEFLSERTAKEDFNNNPIVTGCPDEEFLGELFVDKPVAIYTNRECELAKYSHNAFAALKVWYFNQMESLCDASGDLEYSNVKNITLSSGYINKNHTMVPGPDGHKGFGGKCLPKDLKAFAYQLEDPILKSIYAQNQQVRGEAVVKAAEESECCGGGCH